MSDVVDWNAELRKIEHEFDGLPPEPSAAQLKAKRAAERWCRRVRAVLSFRAQSRSDEGEESQSSRSRDWSLYQDNRDSSPSGLTALRSE
jgi:hypothetical protein